jgi:predicted TPR repeat methyltransferase
MPYSSNLGKIETIQWVTELTQESMSKILDIGVGSGTYINLLKFNHKLLIDSKWIGVEAWEPYIKKYNLNNLYDTIINEDARTINWSNIGSIDLTFAGDVLEHMTKDEAIVLVENILNYSKFLIISLPVCFYPQDEFENNPFEIHVKPDWTHSEVLETWGSFVKKTYVGSIERPNKHPLEIGVYLLSKQT